MSRYCGGSNYAGIGGGGGGGGAGGGRSILWFGAGNVADTTTVRYLYPGYDDDLAQTLAVQYEVPVAGTLSLLRIVQNIPAGNGALITYTVRLNGVATALSATMASTAGAGADLVNSVAVVAGDLIDIEITKAGSTGVAVTDVMAAMLFQASGSSSSDVCFRYCVGPAGSGTEFTSIQAAVNAAVADGASPSTPAFISILSGDYNEDVVVPDGISLQGFATAPVAGPRIIGTGVGPTLTMSFTAAAPPPGLSINTASLRGLTIMNFFGGTGLYVTGTADDVLCLVSDCLVVTVPGSTGVLMDLLPAGGGPQLIVRSVPVVGGASIGYDIQNGQLLLAQSVIEGPTGIHLSSTGNGIISEVLFEGGGAPTIDAGSSSNLFTDCDLSSPMTINGLVTVADFRMLAGGSPQFVGSGTIIIGGDIAFLGGGSGYDPLMTVIRPFGDGPWKVEDSVSKTFADSPYAATGQEGIIGFDPTGGASTVDLPSLATVRGQRITVVHDSASANTVTVVPNGADTIYGAASSVLSSFTSQTFYAPTFGTDWWIVGTG